MVVPGVFGQLKRARMNTRRKQQANSKQIKKIKTKKLGFWLVILFL